MPATRMQEQAMSSDRADAHAPRGDEPFGRMLVALEPQVRVFLSRLQRGNPHAPHHVDDLVQETLARAWRSRSSFDGARDAAPWLLRIAFRAFLDGRDGAPASLPLDDERAAAGPSPAAHAAAREHTAQLLALLSPRERSVLLMFHGDGRSIAQIAAATAQPQ